MKIFKNQNPIISPSKLSSDQMEGQAAEKPKKSGKFNFAKDLFDQGTALRFGGMAEMICDRLGASEKTGDIVALVVSSLTYDPIGMTEHAADLYKDIAAEKGNTELAGFLDAYEQKASRAGYIVGKVTFVAASIAATVVTAGGAAPVGASAVAASAGSTGITAANVFQGIAVLGGVINTGASLENGDKMGAAMGALGVLGGIAGMGDVFGMSASQTESLKLFADKGQVALGFFAKAKEDGEITIHDIKHVPFGELLGQMGGGEALGDSGQQALLEGALGVVASEERGGPLMQLLTSTIMDRALDSLGSDDMDTTALENVLRFFGESMQAGHDAPESMALLSRLFTQLAHSSQAAPARDFHHTPIKM